MRVAILCLSIGYSFSFHAQNALSVPPSMSGTSFNLILGEGTHEFYPGVITNTFGANGSVLGPTIILNQGDNVSFTVNNQLMDSTTIHWHGLHVAPENDGGPHTAIAPSMIWNPQFTVLDKAGTYWYHPHLHMMTDHHVSKGIAGMILVRDSEEAALNIPVTYGVDEFPLVIQTKGFDASGQILVHTDMDTSVMVNATVNAHVDFPAQVVRLRLVNGASQRVMELGFSDNRSFSLIGTDGGLLAAPVALTRFRLAPGQRADILVNLSGSQGQNFQLMNYGAELPNAIYGAAQPGMGPGATASLPNYTLNPLNGANFSLLDISVTAQLPSAITTIPSSLVTLNPLLEANANITRNLTFTSSGAMGNLNGPFVINGATFNMSTINYSIPLDNIEIWSLTNSTPISHPFHIHDVQFYILDINGVAPPASMQGLHDVVLVPAGNGNVRFIAQFTDHTNEMVPYMYHCHMLTHEDLGMMGQFLVTDPNAGLQDQSSEVSWKVFPNPSIGNVNIICSNAQLLMLNDALGHTIWKQELMGETQLDFQLKAGMYYIKDEDGNCQKLIVE